jgi:hypothetical protein
MLTIEQKEKLLRTVCKGDGKNLPRVLKSRAANLVYNVKLSELSLYVVSDEDEDLALDMCMKSISSEEPVWLRCYPKFLFAFEPNNSSPSVMDYHAFQTWSVKNKIFP